MAFYKITKPFNTREGVQLYYGCKWEVREDGVYADVPDYCIENYIKVGHVLGTVQKAVEAPKIKDVAPEKKSAEDVVSGNTKDAVEKKEARVEKAAAVKAPVVKPRVKAPVVKAKPKGK